MLKGDLIARVASRQSMSHREAEAAVDVIFDAMRKALVRLETIEFRGFGRFQVRNYKGYKGRNPRTHEEMEIEPTRGVLFRTGKDLYERLNPKREEERKPAPKATVSRRPVLNEVSGAP